MCICTFYLNKCVCFVSGPQGRDQFEIFSTKFLAFAAAGVRPEPNGWPGKATLRPVDTLLCQIKIANIGKCACTIHRQISFQLTIFIIS